MCLLAACSAPDAASIKRTTNQAPTSVQVLYSPEQLAQVQKLQEEMRDPNSLFYQKTTQLHATAAVHHQYSNQHFAAPDATQTQPVFIPSELSRACKNPLTGKCTAARLKVQFGMEHIDAGTVVALESAYNITRADVGAFVGVREAKSYGYSLPNMLANGDMVKLLKEYEAIVTQHSQGKLYNQPLLEQTAHQLAMIERGEYLLADAHFHLHAIEELLAFRSRVDSAWSWRHVSAVGEALLLAGWVLPYHLILFEAFTSIPLGAAITAGTRHGLHLISLGTSRVVTAAGQVVQKQVYATLRYLKNTGVVRLLNGTGRLRIVFNPAALSRIYVGVPGSPLRFVVDHVADVQVGPRVFTALSALDDVAFRSFDEVLLWLESQLDNTVKVLGTDRRIGAATLRITDDGAFLILGRDAAASGKILSSLESAAPKLKLGKPIATILSNGAAPRTAGYLDKVLGQSLVQGPVGSISGGAYIRSLPNLFERMATRGFFRQANTSRTAALKEAAQASSSSPGVARIAAIEIDDVALFESAIHPQMNQVLDDAAQALVNERWRWTFHVPEAVVGELGNLVGPMNVDRALEIVAQNALATTERLNLGISARISGVSDNAWNQAKYLFAEHASLVPAVNNPLLQGAAGNAMRNTLLINVRLNPL